jgi:hypothetical protein
MKEILDNLTVQNLNASVTKAKQLSVCDLPLLTQMVDTVFDWVSVTRKM